MLWGLTLYPGNVVKETVDYDVHLSMAALETRQEFASSSDGQAQVILQTERGQFVVCTLVYGSIPQQPLDMEIKAGEMVTLFSHGKGVIHLTGNASSLPSESHKQRGHAPENHGEGVIHLTSNASSVASESPKQRGHAPSKHGEDGPEGINAGSRNNRAGSPEDVSSEDVVLIKDEPADSEEPHGQDASVTMETSESLPSTTKSRAKKKRNKGDRTTAKALQSEEKPHECPTCGKGFTQPHNLKTHLRIHSGEKPYTCKTCQKSFSDLGTIRRHERIHTGARPFICDYCGKGFPENAELVRHERIHTGEKPFTCSSCPKSFSDKGQRKRHERTHLEGAERTAYNGQCDVCGKVFKDVSSLRKHKLLHNDSKPHACQICLKTFKDPSTLRQHYRMHDRWDRKEGMIQCINCPAQFCDIEAHNDHTANNCTGVDRGAMVSVKIENVAMEEIAADDYDDDDNTDWLE